MPTADRTSTFARPARAQRLAVPDDACSKLALLAFASALAVLVLNDWLFKGQGILPGWLTGKLSDFAGLVVAPVSLASLVAARRRSTQLGCVAAVALVFALTEVSPVCAELLEQVLARIGLTWRLWPDLGDLWALAALPIGWFCCRALSSHAGARSSAGRVARWLTLPACLACLASGGPDVFSARAYVHNATEATAYVEVSSAWLDCEALAAFDQPFLEPGDFVSQGVFELAPGTVLPLDFLPAGGSSLSRGDCMCPLHRVSAAGRTVNVGLQDLRSVALVQKPPSSDLKKQRGQLVTLRAGQPIQVGTRLGTFELAPAGAGSSEARCPSPEGPALDVSFPPVRDIEHWDADYVTSFDEVPILALTPIAGNCFELAFGPRVATIVPMAGDGADAGDSDAGVDAGDSLPPVQFDKVRFQICAPLFELFPFQAGDRVRWQRIEQTPGDPTLEALEVSNGAARFRLARGIYYSGPVNSNWQDYEASLQAVRCSPSRDADGALFEPIDVSYAGQALVPGRALRIADTNHQIYLGRARRHLARACGVDESWIEVVETWTD